MASVLLSPYGNGQQFFDDNGVPLAGGLIYTYQAGSSTPLVTYTTNNGTIANSNPIVLDASGRTPQQIWLLTGFSYKFVLQNSDGVLIQTLDNIYPILQNAPASAPAIPTGGIILWSGSTGSIPATWFLCDGTNGTPDLRNSFIVGAGSTYAVNATGGSADAIVVTHTHTATSTSTVTDPGHSHTFTAGSTPGGAGEGPLTAAKTASNYSINANTTGITVATTTTNTNAGTSGTNANLPPYYALAYIMKG
jgi:microcystin-dependent protein